MWFGGVGGVGGVGAVGGVGGVMVVCWWHVGGVLPGGGVAPCGLVVRGVWRCPCMCVLTGAAAAWCCCVW